jgi:hypothetical protein
LKSNFKIVTFQRHEQRLVQNRIFASCLSLTTKMLL